MTASERVKAFFPSTSANYINNRSNAGAVGSILQHPTLLKGLRRPGGYLQTRHTEESERIEDEGRIEVDDNQPQFTDAFQTLWLRILSEAQREENNAEPVALAESLKIRVITKGPPFIQTVLRGIWKKMHSIMREHPAFQLIGKPVDRTYVLNRMGAKLEEGQAYLSGDYADATNNLRSWVSDTIAQEFAEEVKLFPVELRMLKKSLTGHTIRGLLQKTGQLMGSVTSFPVLCIANAAVVRWALEIGSKRSWTLRDAPMMINGDDCALRCNDIGYKAWSKIANFVGLESSIGKTYFSRDFVEINSTQFLRVEPEMVIYDKAMYKEKITQGPTGITTKVQVFTGYKKVSRPVPFLETKYVNMGLMLGMKRSGIKVSLNDQQDPVNNIGTRYRQLIKLAPSHLLASIHKNFISHHRPLLTKARVPWYVPEWLGGLGLTGLKEPSELDRRVARAIIINWSKQRPIQVSHNSTPWKTWELASRTVPEPFVVTRPGIGTEVYLSIVADACVNVLFDSNISLDDLFETVVESTGARYLDKNARLWKKSLKPGLLPPPMSLEDMIFQTRYLSYEKEIEEETQFSIAPLD